MKLQDLQELQIEVTVNTRTGEVSAVYFQIRSGTSVSIKEYADGAAFADYDASGKLLGIELLAPCTISVLDEITRGNPMKVKRFVRNSVPHQLVATG